MPTTESKTKAQTPQRKPRATPKTVAARGRPASSKAALARSLAGAKSAIKGLSFEQQVANYYSARGWSLTLRKKIRGLEIDIYGERSDDWGSPEYLLVECKDKERVTSADVMRFMRKVGDFNRRLPEDLVGNTPDLTAIVAHTGVVGADA